MGMQSDICLENDKAGFLTLILKYTPPRMFAQGSHMFVIFTPTCHVKEWSHEHNML